MSKIKSYEDLKKWLEKKKIQERINELAKQYENKSILIYGGGILSSVIFDNYDLSKLNIVGIADKRFYQDDEKFKNYPTVKIDKIKDLNADVILIAVYQPTVIEEFLEDVGITASDKLEIKPIVKKSFLEKLSEVFTA